tara:strand:- start:12 stop:605 length:594 start_codon:yes stop_codon:yes gene_type:complete
VYLLIPYLKAILIQKLLIYVIMNYQESKNYMGLSSRKLTSILSLYFFTLGTLILGFSIYLLISTINGTNSLTTWSGQSLFWTMITFFAALFLLFLPIEFFNNFKLSNSSFNDLIYNVIIVISLSLFFLLIFQTILGNDNLILIEIKSITRSVSFSGFIVIPFLLFIFQNLIVRYEKINRLLYSIILFSWIFSSQFFL